MVTMKAKQMVSKFDLDVLKQPLTFNIIITIIPVGRVMYIYTALTGVDRWIGELGGLDVLCVGALDAARVPTESCLWQVPGPPHDAF